MCGIYGRLGRRDDALDQRATATLHHRGPDDAGVVIDELRDTGDIVALGHTRLAILDLTAAGHQPMTDALGQVAVAFNGEIYNYQSVRKALQARGHAFVSNSDTEVVVHAYLAYGDSCLDHLEGMYALAVWDRRHQRLLLARDPSGIKPLYWRGGSPDLLAFASEAKALLVDPRVDRKPDVAALCGYLAYLYVPTPRTAFDGLHALLPGHKLAWHRGRIAVERFHRYAAAPKRPPQSLAAAASDLETLLDTVVGEHMLADVPVGAFLSGGIDSGLLVAMMARRKRDRGDREPLRTYTVGFGREGHRWDEVDRAARLASHLGVTHEVVRIDATAAAQRFVHVAQQFDEPFANPTALVHDALCEGARREVTVAVAGDGGDEAFAGYPRHRATQVLRVWQHLPARLRSALGALERRLPEQAEAVPLLRQVRRFVRTGSVSLAEAYRDWSTFYTPDHLGEILTADALAAIGGAVPADLGQVLDCVRGLGDVDAVDAACLADLVGFLPDNVLRESDRVSMRHALEVRVPFADRRVVQFGLQLPVAHKLPPGGVWRGGGAAAGKRVLREVARRWLPAEIVDAPKQGFGAPMGAWLTGPLQGLLEQATDPTVLAQRGLVQPAAIERVKRDHFAGRRDHTWHLWALVVLESWFEQRIDRMALPEPVRVPAVTVLPGLADAATA